MPDGHAQCQGVPWGRRPMVRTVLSHEDSRPRSTLDGPNPTRMSSRGRQLGGENSKLLKGSKVLLIIGVDAGNPIGEHRGHQREVKDVLPGHVGMLRV